MLTSEQAAYLAGAIDGEGCITTSGARGMRVQIANTNRAWLEELQRWCGGDGSIAEHRGRFNKRPSYSFVLTTRQSQEVLQQCAPYLILKRQQAMLLFEWVELRVKWAGVMGKGRPVHPQFRDGYALIVARLRDLNKRGVHGQPYPGVPKSTRTCSLEGCTRLHHSNGYCKQHHKKFIERGGPKWHERNCGHCGKPFVAKRSDARVCSRECSYGVYYASHKQSYLDRAKAQRERKKIVAAP